MSVNQVIGLFGQDNAMGRDLDLSELAGDYSGYGSELKNGVKVFHQTQCNSDDGAAACAQEFPPSLPGPRFNNITQFGPELAIARSIPNILSHAPYGTFIAKCATTSSDLATDWVPGAVVGRVLLNRTISCINTNMNRYSGDWEMPGIIWVQGESDSTDLAKSLAYEANLTSFISACRAEWGSSLKFIIAKLHTDNTNTYKNNIRTAQENVAAADPNTYIVSTDDIGFTENGNGEHFGTNESCELGELLATTLDDLVESCG